MFGLESGDTSALMSSIDGLLQIGMYCESQRAELDVSVRLHQLTPEERRIKTAKLEVCTQVLQQLYRIELEEVERIKHERQKSTTNYSQQIRTRWRRNRRPRQSD